MLKHTLLAVARGVVVFLAFCGNSQALELQVSGTASSLNFKNEESQRTDATTAAVAIGGRVKADVSVLLEVAKTDYKVVEKSSGTTLGDYQVSGASYAVILAPRFGAVELRLGYGAVAQTYGTRNLSGDVLAAFDSAGITNYEAKLTSDQGNVLIYGLDVLLSNSISVGVEVRDVKIKVKTKFTYLLSGTPTTGEGTWDGDYTSRGVRLALRF